MWPERAQVVSYTVDSQDEKAVMKAYTNALQDLSMEDWAAELEKDEVRGRLRREEVATGSRSPSVSWKWEGRISYLRLLS